MWNLPKGNEPYDFKTLLGFICLRDFINLAFPYEERCLETSHISSWQEKALYLPSMSIGNSSNFLSCKSRLINVNFYTDIRYEER